MLCIKIKSGVLKVEGILLSRYQLISEDITKAAAVPESNSIAMTIVTIRFLLFVFMNIPLLKTPVGIRLMRYLCDTQSDVWENPDSAVLFYYELPLHSRENTEA